MAKRLLLVDDEESFLQSLKAGLDTLADIFETDICNSVNEAIKNVLSREYDMIVTDLRMPEKSGIDLLIFLKQIKYTGRLMVMSAYNTVDNIKRIRSFGNIDIFSKPFNVDWFRKKLIDFFSKEEEVSFESIDLVTVMQVINLEKSTSAIQVEIDGDNGFIYFEDGEIISAAFNGLRDEDAIREFLSSDKTQIAIKKVKDKVKKTIRKPFVQLLMDLTTKIDESRKDSIGTPDEAERPEKEITDTEEINGQEEQIEIEEFDEDDVTDEKEVKEEKDDIKEQEDIKKQDDINGQEEIIDKEDIKEKIKTKEKNDRRYRTGIKEKLAILKEVSGYLAAGVFTPQGELLEGDIEFAGVDFKEAGSMVNDTMLSARIMSLEAGFGEANMIQIDTYVGYVFCRCYNDGKRHFHTVMIVKTDGNVAMAKVKLMKTIEELVSEF